MSLSVEQIAWAAQMACLLEVSAEKPGNVTRSRDFWDTHLVHFLASAVAAGSAFRRAADATVGELVLEAVSGTQQLVRTNTNLGIVLLLAPLTRAAVLPHPRGLRAALADVLASLTIQDARLAYEAIRRAAPGGMGSVGRHDVQAGEEGVEITLREAMELARERDSVAREYVTDFAITFEVGYASLCRFWAEEHRLSQIIVQTFLTILSQVPDTLIARKKGMSHAQQVSERARRVLDFGGAFTEEGREEAWRLDSDLRDPRHLLNPGTTADLTSASLFVFLTEEDRLTQTADLLERW